jgi:hypothetical protein
MKDPHKPVVARSMRLAEGCRPVLKFGHARTTVIVDPSELLNRIWQICEHQKAPVESMQVTHVMYPLLRKRYQKPVRRGRATATTVLPLLSPDLRT